VSKPYDATLKTLLTASPRDWPRLAGFPAAVVKIIDADLSTVTAATDKVLRLKGPPPSLMHFEFQAGPDASLPHRVLGYHCLLGLRHNLPVHSVIVLLRPEAFLRNITGTYEQHYPRAAEPNLVFHYQVVRVWEVPAATLLKGGIGTLPLAPIGAMSETDLPEVIREMKDRLDQPKYGKIAGELWTAVRILMGLRYEGPFIDQLLRGVQRMKESVTYQEILNEGRAEGLAKGIAQGVAQEAKRILLKQGEKVFLKPANPETLAALEAIQDPEILEQLAVNLLQAKSWEELVPPASKTSRGRKKKS
jgi:predicted transposase YdaD